MVVQTLKKFIFVGVSPQFGCQERVYAFLMHLRETILCQIQGCYPTLTLCRDISLQRLLHTVKQLQYLWVLL